MGAGSYSTGRDNPFNGFGNAGTSSGSDPGEVNNLARRPEGAAAVEEHRRLLSRWITDTGDDFRIPSGAG